MTDREDWQGRVGRNWAIEWQRTDRSFAPLTAQLVRAIEELPGRSIVDIGCGAGELALAIAAARPSASVLGIDVSADLVATASVRGAGQANCAFALADGSNWEPDRGGPDLYISRHGVMFFADPEAAFAHLANVATRGARMVFSCFRARAANPWAGEVGATVGAPTPDPDELLAPGPFAFADPARVEAVLAAGGWTNCGFEAVDHAYVAGVGSHAVADAADYLSRIGPAAAALRDMDSHDRALALDRLRNLLETRRSGDRVTFPAASWIVTAQRG